MNHQTEQTDMLRTALDFEEQGRLFYERTAAESKDPVTRKLFSTLAADEVRHARRFQEIAQALREKRAWPAVDPRRAHGLEQDIRAFFSSQPVGRTAALETIPAYEFAMGLERKSIELYRRRAEDAPAGSTERAFYQSLLAEEQAHLEALRNVHYFLTDSGDWLEQDESRRWNWMTT